MNHLVKRLREGEDSLEYAAADEIEELEDRITALEAALEKAADALHDAGCYEAWAKARAALEGKKDE